METSNKFRPFTGLRLDRIRGEGYKVVQMDGNKYLLSPFGLALDSGSPQKAEWGLEKNRQK